MDELRPVHRHPAPERYGRLRVRTDDLSPALRLTRRAPGPAAFGTVAGVCAPGFDAYVRILHPAGLGERPVRWSTVAAAHGTRVTPGTRWYDVVGKGPDYLNAAEYGMPGVWDEHPWEGPTPPAVAEALIPVLARHTTTAERCWFGLWNGYGRRDLGWLPTFSTPGREEVLLSGALADAVSPVALDEFAELPDLWWPEDHAWCLGGDVDLTSTYVGGSVRLVAGLLAAPDLETYPVGPDDTVVG
ncbi:hypothetical protein ACF09H_10715 [Streptomyces sp. NPDC014983]|uniref:hypothetical protein n=1 Tax=Streptomyces sp. NPDC014983 TaxID=3364933 RepID=UPI0036F66F21